MEERERHINTIGQRHLSDNLYTKKRKYNEFDIMTFEQNKFLNNLYMNDDLKEKETEYYMKK